MHSVSGVATSGDRCATRWQFINNLHCGASTDVSIDAEQVIAEIRRAFDGVSRQGGVSLREADVIDSYGDDEERLAARKSDTDANWQDVSDADIEYHQSALTFLDAIGYRYYLPAYMIWTIKYHTTTSSCSSDFMVWGLDSEDGERLTHFSDEQLRAVLAFLEYLTQNGMEYSGDPTAIVARDAWRICIGGGDGQPFRPREKESRIIVDPDGVARLEDSQPNKRG